MRIYELNPILDGDILGSQVLALDDSTQTRKISLDQIRKFLGVGENSTLIPSGTDIHVYFMTAKSGSYYGEGLVNTAQGGAWAAFDWTTHDQGRGTLTETNNVNELAVHSLAAGAWTKKRIISESGGKINGAITVSGGHAPIIIQAMAQLDPLYLLAKDADGESKFYLGNPTVGSNNATFANYKGGGNYISLTEDGGISLFPKGVAGTIADSYFTASGDSSPLMLKNKTQGKALHILAKGADNTNRWYLGNGSDNNNGLTLTNYKATTGATTVSLFEDGAIRIQNNAGYLQLNTDGSVALTDYRHFDDRYDARYNAKYVQGVQLGAQVIHTPPGNEVSWTFDCPTGNMLTGIVVQETGNGSADNIGGVRHKPIQRNINGVWATIPG